MSKLTAGVLALALNVAPIFALAPATRAEAPIEVPAAAQARIETLVPGTTTGAAFLNVKRIFALYGDLITHAPQYSQVEQAIAAGFPDPANDLDQIGVTSNIENFANSSAGVVITGHVDMDKLMKFAATQHLTFTPSMYRGVTPMTSKLDNRSTQVGFVDENTTLVSIDEKGEGTHEGTKSIIATLKKESPSFGEHNLLTLPANYLANLSLQIPAELTGSLDGVAGGQFAVLKAVKFLAASVTADDRTKDANLQVTLSCDTAENAGAINTLLQTLAASLNGAGHGTELLQQLKITLEGKNVVLSLTIPRSEMEHLVGNN